MVLTLVTIFVIGYFCIAMEHPFKINKTATALMLGTLLWTVFVFCNNVFDPTMDSEAWHNFISEHLVENLGETAEIVFFLLGAMTIVTLVDEYEGFRIITQYVKTRNKKKLMWILSFITSTLCFPIVLTVAISCLFMLLSSILS